MDVGLQALDKAGVETPKPLASQGRRVEDEVDVVHIDVTTPRPDSEPEAPGGPGSAIDGGPGDFKDHSSHESLQPLVNPPLRVGLGHSDFGRMAAYSRHVQGLQSQLRQHEAMQYYTIVMLSR